MSALTAGTVYETEYYEPMVYLRAVPLREVVDVHEVQPDVAEWAHEFIGINADELPGLKNVREQAREEATQILEQNRQKLMDGNFEDVLLDVDAVGTARKVALVREKYGVDSPEYNEAWEGLVMDSSRKWAEAFRKNWWEYFGITSQKYSAEEDDLMAHGMSMDAAIRNGLSPVAEPEEAQRRINEYVNLQTHKMMVKSQVPSSAAAIHISPCTEWAHKSLRENPKSGHGGYAPEIDKLMLNVDSYDVEEAVVYHDQLGVTGKRFTPEVITEAYRRISITNTEQVLDRTQIHATIGIVPREKINGAVDLLKFLDEVASELSGKNIFIGEEVPPETVKDYSIIYIESEQRRMQQEGLSLELAQYVMGLHDSHVDPAAATMMVEAYIQNKLLGIAAQDPTQAAVIFNAETAQGFHAALELRRQGRYEEAQIMEAQVRVDAPQASSCGGGSCGLENIEVNSAEGSLLAKRLGLEVGDKIAKDKVRACKNCKTKSLVYGYNDSKVNTLCTNTKCNAFRHTQTTGKAA